MRGNIVNNANTLIEMNTMNVTLHDCEGIVSQSSIEVCSEAPKISCPGNKIKKYKTYLFKDDFVLDLDIDEKACTPIKKAIALEPLLMSKSILRISPIFIR